jgi:tRNA A37 threonylcarbamoyladenosine dehydratase
MTDSMKNKILLAVGRAGKVEDTRDLVADAADSTHSIIHLLYSLRNQGLVTFRYAKAGTKQQRPRRIQLTLLGETQFKELTR